MDFFLAILGRGPCACQIGKISNVNPEFGKFSDHFKLIIFSIDMINYKFIHLELLNNN